MQYFFRPCAEFTELDCENLYRKAITDSPTINLHVAKALTIGPPRVGKTTLRHLLLDLEPPEVIVSTPLMKTAETVTIMSSVESEMIRLGKTNHGCRKTPWLLVNEASGILSLLRFLQQQVDQAAICGKAAAAKEPVQAVTTNTAPLLQSQAERIDTDVHPVYKEEKVISQDPSDVTATAKRLYQSLQSPDITNVELSDCKLLQFLDCGGQLAYHDILPVFTTIPAVYLHVFNLNEDLKNCPVDQICFSQDGGEVYASARSPLTVAQMITQSVMTVHSLTAKNVEFPEVVLQSAPPEPCVVLVGTHLDKLVERCKGDFRSEFDAINVVLKDALDSPSQCLNQMLVKNQDRALPSMFFPVCRLPPGQDERDKNSSNDKSSGITRHSIFEVKQKIEKLVNAVQVKVPVKWYLHQMLEISNSREPHKPVHRYCDLWQSCLCEKAVSSLGEFHAMVTYFHALGLLIHLCGKDVPHNEKSACQIFTDPSYLFENITKLYQVQFQEEDRCEGSLQPLRCQGRLTKKALRALNIDNAYLSDDDFMDLLVQLFIGADITEKVGDDRNDGRVLFLPSVIPIRDTRSQHTVIPEPSCPYFIITFKGTFFIPCGVFTGVIARLQSIPHWNMCYGSISRLHAKFSIGALDTIFLTDSSTHIKVGVHAQHNAEECRNFIIDAIAQSYCFLFHGKASENSQCGICKKKPFLILGLSCHCATCDSRGARNIAKLCIDESKIPRSVRCLVSGDAEELCHEQSSLFWNIKHHVSMHKCIICF